MRSVAITLLCCLLPLVSAIIVDKKGCGPKFYCPDKCSIAWKDGCPQNCNCASLKKCPLVSCPAKAPICSIYTQLDGCQSCACKLPYLLVEEDGDSELSTTGFVFLGRRDAPLIRKRLDDSIGAGDDFMLNGKKVIKANMCTLSFMEKIDECTKVALGFTDFLRSKRADDAIPTLNPMVKTDKPDLEKMCTLYRKALLCIGPNIFNECRHQHPHLSELDAIYGYACGEKKHIFLSHLDCIQRTHVESFRLAICEDSAHRALRFIETGSFDVEEKQKQKCDAMTWLINCEKPTIQTRCSMEAREVNEEALMAATDYIAPECHPDYERKVFISDEELQLVNQKPLVCLERNQKEIEKHFANLARDVARQSRRASIAYPVGYSYTKSTLLSRCAEYRTAMNAISGEAKRNCVRRFDLYNSVYFVLGYPCGHGTQDYFFKYFDCLTGVRKVTAVRNCEASANRALDDPSNDQCETYNLLTECMYDHVVDKCGYDGWEMEYQYLSLSVRNSVPDCSLKRIFRPYEKPE